MPFKPALPSTLASRIIALPESRQLDVLADLCERRQAQVIRVPLVSILDAADQTPIITWLRHFVAEPPDYFIVLTGEGLRRLLSAASRIDLEPNLIKALATVCKICRGPKPARVLKELKLKPQYYGTEPTTTGIIEILQTIDLQASAVAVQLYGEDPNTQLMDYLATRQLRSCSPVAPYVYASNSDTEEVVELILKMAADEVDVIAFTSKPQIKRLFNVAAELDLHEELGTGLGKTKIAAVGPIVRDALVEHGCEVSAMPESAYFMKPLVRAMELLYSEDA